MTLALTFFKVVWAITMIAVSAARRRSGNGNAGSV
jgi:hypothetical protein